jgi:hypothetical protein
VVGEAISATRRLEMSNDLRNTKCLGVTFHIAGDSRKGNLAGVSMDADKSDFALSKRIFRSDAYDRCWKVRDKTRDWLAKRALPSPLKAGTYLIPATLTDDVEAKLQEAKAEFAAAADLFVSEYPAKIEEAKTRLNSQFNSSNYPSQREMRSRFWVEKMWLDFAPVTGMDQSEELKQALNEVRVTLRAGLLELVQRLSNMLGCRKDGKKKGVRKEAVEAFGEWMSLLPARLVVDDDELKALAVKAKAIMEGKSVDDLRDIETVRSQTREGLEQVGKQLEGLLKDMPSRAFSFDD